MSQVHFVGGEKGGVGKSVLARVIAQYCIDRRLRMACVDADTSHGALLRYYGQYTQAADLENFASADQIMDRALGDDRSVLVDLPAQSARLLKRWLDSGEVLNFAREMGVEMYFWHVTDGGYDSINELDRALSTLGGDVRIIVVRNFGRSPDFSQFEESPTKAGVLGQGGAIVDLPALDGATMYKIDRQGSSFWAAVNQAEGELALSPMERRRAKLWLNSAYENIDRLGIQL